MWTSVDVVVDVNGYYANHNHDDLYAPKGESYTRAESYTKAEVDGLLAARAAAAVARLGEIDAKISPTAASVVAHGTISTGASPRIGLGVALDGYLVDIASPGAGRHVLTITGPFVANQDVTMMVTAFSANENYCTLMETSTSPVGSLIESDAIVDCFDGSGTRTDTHFSWIAFT